MKYIIYLLAFFTLQFGLGAFNSEYIYYFTSFQVGVFILVNIFLKFRFKLNNCFFYFSYSIILLILSFFIEFSLIIYFFIFITPLTILFAKIFFYHRNITYKIIIFLSVISYSIISIIIIHENLFYKNNFKSDYNKKIEITFYDENDRTFIFEKNKTYILDFWTTNCGVCIEKFPDFNKISKKYLTNPNIKFYTVNVRLNENDKIKVIKYTSDKTNYFKNLYIKSKEEANIIDVNAYPTILIIKGNKIIYNGYPSFDSYVLFNNLDKLISDNSSNTNF